MPKSNEPIWWSLFSAGGVVAAFFIPGLVIVTGWVLPSAEGISYEDIRNMAANPLGRLFFLTVISLPLFHWAHRFRYTLIDLGIHGFRGPIAVVCYGVAIVGTAWGGYLIATLGG